MLGASWCGGNAESTFVEVNHCERLVQESLFNPLYSKKKRFFHPLWISVELQTASLGSESMSRRSAACVIPCCLFISWLIAEVTLWDGHPNYLTVLKYPHWVPAVTSPAQHTLTGLLSFIKGGCKSLCTAPQETDSKIKKNIIFFKLKHHDVWSFYPNALCICICGLCVHQG